MEKYPLHEKVLSSDLEGVQSLFITGIDLNELDDHGNSALHWATLRGDAEIVMRLLELGADPNIFSTDGYTPKWSAADFGLEEIIQIFDQFGGKIKTDQNFDKTSWSVFKGALGQDLPQQEG